jgi:hypothetical protein
MVMSRARSSSARSGGTGSALETATIAPLGRSRRAASRFSGTARVAEVPIATSTSILWQKDLEIQEYTDPDNDPMIPHTIVLKPGLVVHTIYNGYWFWSRPSFVDLWHDFARRHARDSPRLGPEQARAPRSVGRRRLGTLPRLGQAGGGAERRLMSATICRARPRRSPGRQGVTGEQRK